MSQKDISNPEEVIRDIELSKRKERIRNSKNVYKWHSPSELKDMFAESIRESNFLLEYAIKIEESNKDVACDIYRQQIINLESFFDYFCHSIFKYGFLKMFRGEWEKTEKYYKFQINLADVEKVINNYPDESWLLEAVDNKTKNLTFMKYKDIKDNFNYFFPELIEKAATKVFKKGNQNDNLKEIREFLDSLYDRRNLIAHQHDRDFSTGKKNSISLENVKYYTRQLNLIVVAITEVLDERPDIE